MVPIGLKFKHINSDNLPPLADFTFNFTPTSNEGPITIIGGENESFNVLDSSFVYFPSTEEWSVATSGAYARRNHACGVLRGEWLICHGGHDSNKEIQGHIWWINLITSSSESTPREDLLQPLFGHSMHALGDDLIVFGGGKRDGTTSNQLYVVGFDSTANLPTFTPFDTSSSEKPDTRAWHAHVDDGINTLYISGGMHASKDILNDLWRYEHASSTWTSLSASSPQPFSPLSGHTLFLSSVTNTLYFHAGERTDMSVIADVSSFDLTTSTWTAHPLPMESPSPRCAHRVIGLGPNTWLMYGGVDWSTMTVFDDAWIITEQ